MRKETPTCGLGSITSAAPGTPFTLPVRVPGWFTDGADSEKGTCQPLFHEEVIGIKDGKPIPFGVRFSDEDAIAKDGNTTKWILGSKIAAPTDPREKTLTNLVWKLAVKVRQYNASLYRLRRFHFSYDYAENGPAPNPHGDQRENPPERPKVFRQSVMEAEADWRRVTRQLNEFLEKGHTTFGPPLLAADMITVNGYVVSMRVVAAQATTRKRGRKALEVGGSSSHVSISSPLSSSSQDPESSMGYAA